MSRLFLFNALVFLGVFVFHLEAKFVGPVGCRYAHCSYTGDPHLTPFFQSSTYWCKKPGWELLLSNPYVTIYVLVDTAASYYSIIDYVLVFPGPPSCTTFGSSSNAWPCIGWASPVWTVVSGNTRIYFHKTQCLVIKIVKWGSYFNFYIWQGASLIKQSCGVCVKWNCELEYRWANPNPVVPQICDGFIKAAQARAIGVANDAATESARTSCINDLQQSADIDNAKIAATTLLQKGLEEILATDDGEAVFEKLDALTQDAVQEATAEANKILANSEKYCSTNKCLGPDDGTTINTGTDSSTPNTDATQPVTRVPIGVEPIIASKQK